MSEKFGGQDGSVSGSEAATDRSLSPGRIVSPLAEICAALKALQSQRRFCIRLQSRCNGATEAFIARHLGYHSGLAEEARQKLFQEAGRLRRAVERSGGGDQLISVTQTMHVAAACAPLILLSAAARKGFDDHRSGIEKRMRAAAQATPGAEFVAATRGFGELALAIVIGEAGDLALYANPAKLWKRLGFGVIDHKRQRCHKDKELAALHGYSAARHGEIFAAVSTPLFFAQSAAKGEYRALYETRRAHTAEAHPEWTKTHARDDAVRYITKRALRELWRAWRAAGEGLSPGSGVPPAEFPEAAE